MPAPTWILVAARDRADVRRTLSGNQTTYPIVQQFTHEIARLQPHELGTDAPGRVQTHGQNRAAYEPQDDEDMVDARRFAKELAQWLDAARHRGEFEKLIVIAPPKFLGVLRESWSSELSKKVVLDVDSDLSGLNEQNLSKRLDKLIEAEVA